jgi:hypothetical protein
MELFISWVDFTKGFKNIYTPIPPSIPPRIVNNIIVIVKKIRAKYLIILPLHIIYLYQLPNKD